MSGISTETKIGREIIEIDKGLKSIENGDFYNAEGTLMRLCKPDSPEYLFEETAVQDLVNKISAVAQRERKSEITKNEAKQLRLKLYGEAYIELLRMKTGLIEQKKQLFAKKSASKKIDGKKLTGKGKKLTGGGAKGLTGRKLGSEGAKMFRVKGIKGKVPGRTELPRLKLKW